MARPAGFEPATYGFVDYKLLWEINNIGLLRRAGCRFYTRIATHGVPIYLFPIGESYGMPIENIYGALSVLWNAEKNGHKVFMYCMAGRNHSVMIADCYYFMRQGNYRADNSSDVLYGQSKRNELFLNINDNQLPGIYRMELFLERCTELFNNPEIADGALIDWIKKETFGF